MFDEKYILEVACKQNILLPYSFRSRPYCTYGTKLGKGVIDRIKISGRCSK